MDPSTNPSRGLISRRSIPKQMYLEALYYVNLVKISHLTNRYSSMAMIPPSMFCIFPRGLGDGGGGHGQEGSFLR